MANITAVYIFLFPVSLKIFDVASSYYNFFQCVQTLVVSPLSPCYQEKCFLFFSPKSSIERAHLFLASCCSVS